MVRLDTALRPGTFKVSRLDGRVVTVTPEFDESARIARDRVPRPFARSSSRRAPRAGASSASQRHACLVDTRGAKSYPQSRLRFGAL